MSELSDLWNRLAEVRSAAHRAVAAIPDETLPKRTVWNGAPVELRYLLYRLADLDGERRVALARTLTALGWAQSEAQRILAQAWEARGALQGCLAGFPDDLLDRRWGGGEWSVREVLDHCHNTDQRYWMQTAHAVARLHSAEPMPLRMPEEGMPARAPSQPSPGGLAMVRQRMARVRQQLAGALAPLTEDELAAPAVWTTLQIDARFRLYRFAAHDREHTVQLQKTLDGLGWRPTEAQRILGQAEGERGRLEGMLLGLPRSVAAQTPPDYGASVRDLLTRAAEDEASLLRDLASALERR